MITTVRNLLKSRDGNFAITTAFVIPVLLMGIGIAIDVSSMTRKRDQLQNAVDSAALAATSAMVNDNMSTANAKLLAAAMLRSQMGASTSTTEAQNLMEPSVTVSQTLPNSHSKLFTAKIVASYNVPLSGFQVLLGRTSSRITAVGMSQSEIETKNPLSMYLVLDRSGSMQWVTSVVDTTQSACDNYYESNWPHPTYQSPCYIKKINSLKTAVKALADQLDANDDTHEYVRTGAVSYNTAIQTPQDLSWGTSSVRTYVNALTASGGTNAAPGMQKAYESLNAATENSAHKAKNGGTPAKFILLMTDGANDNTNNDATTLQWCTTAKNAGMKIYTVAFVAPDRGKQLLASCSSGTDYYYEASSVAQLIAAFQAIGQKTSKLTNRLTQ